MCGNVDMDGITSDPADSDVGQRASDSTVGQRASDSDVGQRVSDSEVGERVSLVRALLAPEVLSQVAERALGPCQVADFHIQPANTAITGFLGDHFRLSLSVRLPDGDETLRLFVKTSSLLNPEKAAFIDSGNFFRRERLLFSLFDDLGGGSADGPRSWHVDVLYHSRHLLVMRDAAALGYRPRGPPMAPPTACPPAACPPMDAAHLLAGAAALARYHAAQATHSVRRRTPGLPYPHTPRNERILEEHNFKDCPWLRAAARLDADLIHTFSSSHAHLPDLRGSLERLFLQACSSLRHYADTLNVLIHKDGWANNLVFRYDRGVPVHALLLDYQCVRLAPPAFDLMIYIYLNTTTDTRKLLERQTIERYYEEFRKNLDSSTKEWLDSLGYDLSSLSEWCDNARMVGMVVSLSIFPYILMDGVAAAVFDDRATFRQLCDLDRAPPVIEYARSHPHYRDMQVAAAEEFIQRYLLTDGDSCPQ